METPSIHAESIVTARRDLPFSRLHDDLLALDAQKGYCYSMNASAAGVWELISQPITVRAICAALCATYTVDSETCLRDVVQFLSAMRDAGLIQLQEVAYG